MCVRSERAPRRRTTARRGDNAGVDVLCSVARNKFLTAGERASLIEFANARVATVVASHANLSPADVAALRAAYAGDFDVAIALARNASAPLALNDVAALGEWAGAVTTRDATPLAVRPSRLWSRRIDVVERCAAMLCF